MDPRDPNVLYAALWQRIRRKWSDPRVEPGYNEGGVIKTTDGGKTWTDVSQGLPAPEFRGRIGIDISRVEARHAVRARGQLRDRPHARSRASATPTAGRCREGKGFIKGADVYRTDDGGKTWRQTSR